MVLDTIVQRVIQHFRPKPTLEDILLRWDLYDWLIAQGFMERSITDRMVTYTMHVPEAPWVWHMMNATAWRRYNKPWKYPEIPSGSYAFTVIPIMIQVLGRNMTTLERWALVESVLPQHYRASLDWCEVAYRTIQKYGGNPDYKMIPRV